MIKKRWSNINLRKTKKNIYLDVLFSISVYCYYRTRQRFTNEHEILKKTVNHLHTKNFKNPLKIFNLLIILIFISEGQ